MNFKTTVLLLIVLVVIGAVSWQMGVFAPAPKAGTEPAKVVEANKLLLIAPQLKDLTKVRLEVAGKGARVFEKKGDKWDIVEPVTAPAVGWELTDLVSTFEQARRLESFVPGEGTIALKDTGLDNPTYKITFEEKGRTLTYLVGKNVVATDNTYVKAAEDNEVVVVDQNLRTKVKKDLNEYRDKQLWELKRDKITEMTATGRDGKKFVLAKGSDEKWVMSTPVQAPVGSEPVNEAVGAVSMLRAEEFTDDEPKSLAKFGLDKPAWTVTITETETLEPTTKTTQPAKPTVKRTEHVLLIGNPSGLKSDQVFAKLADKKWVVTLKDETIRKLIPDATAWREKKVLDLDRNAIRKVQIQKGGREVSLVKSDAAWKLESPEGEVAADVKTADALADALTQMEAASFTDQPDKKFLARAKLDSPVAKVRITTTSSADPIELVVGDTTPSGMFRYVRKMGREYVSAVAVEKIAPVMQSYLAYQNRRMMDFNIDNVKSVQVVRGKQTYKVERADRNQPWKVTSPLATGADQDAVRDMVMSLTTLDATDFADRGNLERYSLAKPLATVTVTTENEVAVPVAAPKGTSQPASQPATKPQVVRKEFVLAVAKADGRTYAARKDVANPLIAQVPDKLFSDLTSELIDRKVFENLPTSAVDRIEIKKPGREPMVFEKSGSEWKYPADPVVALDKDKVEQIISALGQVRAKRYVEINEPGKFDYGLKQPHFVITATAGKAAYTLTVGKVAEGKTRYAQTGNRPWVFALTAEEYDKLDKNLKDLLKQAPTPTPQNPPGGMGGGPPGMSMN